MTTKHTLTSIEFNDTQKQLIAKAIQAGALDNDVIVPTDDEKLVIARDLLDELGVIDYSYEKNTIKINNDYVDVFKQLGIIDDSMQLTPEMQQIIQPVQENFTFMKYLSLID